MLSFLHSLIYWYPAYNALQALNSANPNNSINSRFEKLYIERDFHSEIDKVKKHLLHELNFPKILFSGPNGCGKTTELFGLSQDKKLQRNFHIRFIPTAGIGGNALKLLKIITKSVKGIADSEGLSNISKKIDKLLKYEVGWSERVEAIGSYKREIVNGNYFNSNFNDDDQDVKIIKRKKNDAGINEIVGMINTAIDEIYNKRFFFKKNILLIITGLDKISDKDAVKLFQENAAYLSTIKCFTIYTFPVSMAYNKNFGVINDIYAEIYFLPNFNPFTLKNADEYSEQEYEAQREMLLRRVSENLFENDEVIDKIIMYSGGVPFEMFNLIRYCCLIITNSKPWWKVLFRIDSKITEEILDEVINNLKNVYRKSIFDQKRDILKYVRKHKDYKRKFDDDFTTLVAQKFIIHYQDGDNIWFDVNPIIKEILDQQSEKEKKDEAESKENEATEVVDKQEVVDEEK